MMWSDKEELVEKVVELFDEQYAKQLQRPLSKLSNYVLVTLVAAIEEYGDYRVEEAEKDRLFKQKK